MPLEQVLRYGAEIAEGLDKAHRCGVVHRDLKPGNIMLTKSGAKLMDFGLAKSSMAVDPPPSGLTATLTDSVASRPLTAEGTIIGTFQYMSPEQLSGKGVDARSDIFSFGALLYEMARASAPLKARARSQLLPPFSKRSRNRSPQFSPWPRQRWSTWYKPASSRTRKPVGKAPPILSASCDGSVPLVLRLVPLTWRVIAGEFPSERLGSRLSQRC